LFAAVIITTTAIGHALLIFMMLQLLYNKLPVAVQETLSVSMKL